MFFVFMIHGGFINLFSIHYCALGINHARCELNQFRPLVHCLVQLWPSPSSQKSTQDNGSRNEGLLVSAHSSS
jgi:hypothetical protein